MKIITKAKNIDISPALQKFIDKKVATLKKFISILKDDAPGKTLAEVFVEVQKETRHHRKGEIFKCQLEVRLPGKKLVAQAKSDDLQKAVIDAKEQLKLEIEKYKFKKIDKTRRQQRKTKKEIIL